MLLILLAFVMERERERANLDSRKEIAKCLDYSGRQRKHIGVMVRQNVDPKTVNVLLN